MRIVLGLVTLIVFLAMIQTMVPTSAQTSRLTNANGQTSRSTTKTIITRDVKRETVTAAQQTNTVTEAPTGFDHGTNGYVSQADIDADRVVFEERDDIEKGLGPVYNAQSCAECHQSPATGGISQIAVLRAGHLDSKGMFKDAPGGSLINDRAIDPSIQEVVPDSESIRTFRASLNVLGDGYVEAIDDTTLTTISDEQAQKTNGFIKGEVVWVPVLEDPGLWRVGRFGWKTSTPVCFHFRAMPILTKSALPIGYSRPRTLLSDVQSRHLTLFPTAAPAAKTRQRYRRVCRLHARNKTALTRFSAL